MLGPPPSANANSSSCRRSTRHPGDSYPGGNIAIYAKAGYKHVLAGAAKAGVAVEVQQPSAFTLLDPKKLANGAVKKAYSYDTDAKANAKRAGP